MSSTVAVKAFAEGVTQQIKDYLPEEYQNMQCEISEQQKNNSVVLTGIVLSMPGQQIAPVVYMEPFYDQVRKGEPMDQIMNRIADVCRQSLSVRELPETLDKEKLAKAVDELFEKYPAGVASVYLQMFQLQTEDGWEELAEVLANDPRVTIR